MGLFDELDQALRWIRTQEGRSQVEIARSAGITTAMLCAA
jgi:hypothetical protein